MGRIIGLKERYESIVNEYVRSFVYRCFDDCGVKLSDIYWVGGRVGECCEINDYFINFGDIKYVVDNNVSSDTFFRWYNYCNRLSNIDPNIITPNLQSYHKGCPVYTEEEISKIEESATKLNIHKKEFEEELEKFKKNEKTINIM